MGIVSIAWSVFLALGLLVLVTQVVMLAGTLGVRRAGWRAAAEDATWILLPGLVVVGVGVVIASRP